MNSGHHLIYGVLQDVISGKQLIDTDDERLRQGLYTMLLEEKGYVREELWPRRVIETAFSGNVVRSTIDVTLVIDNRDSLILRYGAGSLVSRERSAIAAARLLNPDYQIPLAVVSNGKDAELLDTHTKKVIGQGMAAIPDRNTIKTLLASRPFQPPLKMTQQEGERRILNAFDLDLCCQQQKEQTKALF